MGLFGAAICLAPHLLPAVQAQDDVIREGDLREADHAAPGSWEHVDELASELEGFAQALHDEVHLHLEGHIYFPHMDEHAEEIEALAEHIHDLAHKGKSIKHLRQDVIELDGQVHHADEVITKIARHGVRAVHYDGAIRQTRRIVKSMNEILHHLEADLAELDPDDRQEAFRPGPGVAPTSRRPSEEYHDRYPHRGFERSPHGHFHHDH
jgi:hypothetical protein